MDTFWQHLEEMGCFFAYYLATLSLHITLLHTQANYNTQPMSPTHFNLHTYLPTIACKNPT